MTDFKRDISSQSRVAEHLRQIVALNASGDKLPTVRELCEELRVSARTINAALSELEAQGLIERVHSVGIFVRDRQTSLVAVAFDERFFLSEEPSPFWNALWRALQVQLSAQKLEARRVLLHPDATHGSNRQFLDDVDAKKYDGVLGLGIGEASAQALSGRKMPFVAYAGSGAWVVLNDLEAMMTQCVRALLELGCQTVGLWHSTRVQSSFDEITEDHLERLFRFEVENLGLQTEDFFIQNPRFALSGKGATSLSSQEQGMALARQMLESGARWPDGIVVTNDMMTLGMLRVLDEHVRREHSAHRVLDASQSDHKPPVVGRDLQIATHANAGSSALQNYEDRIARVEVDPAQIAAAMIQVLQQLLAHQTPAARRYYVGQITRHPKISLSPRDFRNDFATNPER